MKVSPSLLSANFADMRPDLEMINASESDYLHMDIMDGVFVPNISFGFPVMKSVSKICEKPLDVHLMIVEPQKWISQVRDCGAEIMNVHQEACLHLHSCVQQIHAAGMKAGVTLCPATPVSTLTDIIEDLDLVLLMSVNPGFGGQPFIGHTLKKTAELRELISRTGSKAEIEIDGGVNLETGAALAEAGADILVAGSFVFGSADPLATIRELKQL
ncbi:MAG: ribulose-phosphate 3-epimerase [Muribaculaceae bacterium]|nr:ribulose-phosphate 3-epimerase [Muribaculaceae bacterium]MDE6382534.1 ribulose-phosphate 3-epimerase [Muribaculaceae bacterium]